MTFRLFENYYLLIKTERGYQCMNSNSMELNIQKFAEGGAEGSSSENAAVAQSQSGANAVNAADNTSVAGENNGSQQEIDFSSYSEEQIEELIDKNPTFNKVMGKRMKNSFGKRLAQERAKMQEEMEPVNDLVDELMIQYDASSFEELSKKLRPAIRDDFNIRNGLADEAGNRLFDLQKKDMQNKRAYDEYVRRQAAERQTQEWDNEVKATKEIYPNFDAEKELENPEFGKLLKSGVGMEHAYKVIHMDEIVEAAKKDTAAAYEKSTVQMQARPSENGLGNQVAVNGQRDVSKLTKKERAELAKRAQRGEVITF